MAWDKSKPVAGPASPPVSADMRNNWDAIEGVLGATALANPSTVGIVLTTLPTGIGSTLWARCTSALTKNANITPADITGLAFAVGASQTWSFQFYVKGICPAAADWRFAITGPAAPTAVWYGVLGSMDLPAGSAAAAFATDVFAGGGVVEETLIVQGLLRNGANAGTVQLQMAQINSTAGDTIVRAESYVIAQRLA